jgi:hypothetical protein
MGWSYESRQWERWIPRGSDCDIPYRLGMRMGCAYMYIQNQRSESHQQQESKPTYKKIQHKDDIFHITEPFHIRTSQMGSNSSKMILSTPSNKTKHCVKSIFPFKTNIWPYHQTYVSVPKRHLSPDAMSVTYQRWRGCYTYFILRTFFKKKKIRGDSRPVLGVARPLPWPLGWFGPNWKKKKMVLALEVA